MQVQKAFTLIELILVVAIIGILAAIAIPVYLDFTIRTRVAELLVAAGALRTAVAEKAQQDGGELANAGVGLTVAVAGRVTSGEVSDAGVITIAGNPATLGTAVTLVLTPTMTTRSKLVWQCSAASAVWKYVPSECRH